MEGFSGHGWANQKASGGAQFGGHVAQCFRHDDRVPQDRHEVGVALPARHDVNVQVPGDAGARDFAQVDPDVEPIRFHHARERVLAAPRELQQIRQFFVRQPVQVRRLPVRHDHKVAARIRVRIEQSVTSAVTRDDVVGLVVARLGDPREEALGVLGLWRQDVFDPPWSVQWFHAHRLVTEAGNVKNVRLDPKGRVGMRSRPAKPEPRDA